jgi:tetratricopeptide (TPR) repeat protein
MKQGDLAAARPLYERALAIHEKALGPEHPTTARSLNNLGRLLRDLGQSDKAELLFQRAIAIGDKPLGTDHPLTPRKYNSHYANVLIMTDRVAES